MSACRVMFSSSCSNYGPAGGPELLDEEAELNPVIPYGASKVLVERDVAQLSDDCFSPHDQAFNVASTGANYPMRELAEIVTETVPGCRVGFAVGASADTRNDRVSGEKAASVLGYKSTWDARRGAGRLYEAYRVIGLTTGSSRAPGTSGSPTSGSFSARSRWTCGCGWRRSRGRQFGRERREDADQRG